MQGIPDVWKVRIEPMVVKKGILLFCCMLLLACQEDEQCRLERYVRLHVSFYQMTTNLSTGVQSEGTLYVDTLSVQGIGVDGYIREKAAGKDTVQLLLDKENDISEFIFTFEDTLRQLVVTDTLSVYYSRTESYLSFECGCLYTFTIDPELTSATNHFIDSIVIYSTEVNTANEENIKIYHTP